MTISETNQKLTQFRSSFSLKNHFLNCVAVLKDGYFLGMALIFGPVFAAFYGFISIFSYLYINQFGIQETNCASAFIGIAVSYLIGTV